ncbi:MAG TPA: ATP-binding protein, partial [Fimbriimonadaceae bacterium]|nr:ATP-binding protein [Fimbriimonadaceae bacterium]
MFQARNRSIKLKLTLIAVLTSTLSLIVASAGFILYDLTSFKAKMRSDLATEAQVISANCGAPLVFGDAKALNETLHALQNKRDIRSVAVYDMTGNLVAKYARPGEPRPPAHLERTKNRAGFEGSSLTVLRTIFSDQDAVGTLYIDSDLSAWEARRNRYFAIVLPLIGASVLISLILGIRLQRIISAPVLDLLNTTRQVSNEKRFDVRANKRANDEIGQLVDGFNEMLSEIETRDRELHEMNEELEERVRRRTLELEQEIAERQAAQEEAAKGRELLDDFFENAAIGLHFLSPDGIILRANKAELKMLGYSTEEFVGKPARAFHEDPSVIDGLLDRIAQGEVISDLESRMISKDGTVRWVALEANGRWQGDTFLHARCFTRDLTSQKEADRMREVTERAERSNQAKSEFLSRMSHELRTPMNSILGFGQLLESDALTEDQLDSVRQIVSAGKHLLRLIDEVLDISRIETGNISLSIEPVDAYEALREVIGFVQPLARGRSITIEYPDCEQASFVRADSQRLRQVLINLLSNAIKYNHEGGRVTVRIDVDGDWLRFNVIDTGRGISPDSAEQLFIPFQRLGAESTAIEGTGLGLAVSLRLAEAMGGTINLRPTKSGAHFCFELQREDVVENAPSDLDGTGDEGGPN